MANYFWMLCFIFEIDKIHVINHHVIQCYDKIWKKSRDIHRFRPMSCKLHIDLVVYPLWCNVHCRGKLCTKWKQYQKQKEKIFLKKTFCLFWLFVIFIYYYFIWLSQTKHFCGCTQNDRRDVAAVLLPGENLDPSLWRPWNNFVRIRKM